MSKNNQQVIGSKALIDFPTLGLESVPAKVDTGADSSAVSASNIVERDGKLFFTLFDESSPYYTGKPIESTEYTIRSVKNSFGHTELRYKVPMSIRLDGRRIRARLSLANRSNNRYPVIIGRRSLQDRFLVDVGKNKKIEKSGKSNKILVLVALGRPQSFDFYDEINSLYGNELKIDLITYDELCYKIKDNDLSISIGIDGRSLEEYGLIYFKSTLRYLENAALVHHYAKKRGIKIINTAASLAPINDKVHQGAFMALNSINVPDTWLMSLDHLEQNFKSIKKEYKLPFILKDLNGKQGRYNFLVKTELDFNNAVKVARKNNLRLLAQPYIKNDGDYRIVVFGKQVKLIAKRTGDKSKTHLNNVSAGADAVLVEPKSIPGEVLKDSIKAASLMQWQVAGVDMIKDKNSGKWYCLEVNNSPQIVDGDFITEKMHAIASYFKWELEK